MPRSRRPGLIGSGLPELPPRTPGLLGVNDAADLSWRERGVIGDTPGLIGFNDWADPNLMLAAAATPATFVPQDQSISVVAANKMWDLFKNHPNQVGRNRSAWLRNKRLPDDTQGRERTDCITYVKAVLVSAYEETSQKIISKGIRKALGANGLGTDLANYLVREVGWKAHYWNPDVSHPRDYDYARNNYSYWNTLKHGVYYAGEFPTKVPVSGYIVNYRPVIDHTNPRYEDKRKKIKHDYATTPERDAFERFKQVKFAFGLARGGDHTFMYSDGYIFEVHWNALGDDSYSQHVDADGDDLYERSLFEDFPGWYSGLMVVPPDSKFESDQK